MQDSKESQTSSFYLALILYTLSKASSIRQWNLLPVMAKRLLPDAEIETKNKESFSQVCCFCIQFPVHRCY